MAKIARKPHNQLLWRHQSGENRKINRKKNGGEKKAKRMKKTKKSGGEIIDELSAIMSIAQHQRNSTYNGIWQQQRRRNQQRRRQQRK